MATDNYWFPVKVKNNTEYDVFRKLLSSGFKVYMPLTRYVVQKNEKDTWKLKPIFKGKMFVLCKFEDLLHLQSIDNNIKYFFKDRKPEYIDDKNIVFIKKALSSGNEVEIVNKEMKGAPFIDIDSPEFGALYMKKSVYREKDVISWAVPVIKNTLIIEPDSIFLKYLIYENQDNLV